MQLISALHYQKRYIIALSGRFLMVMMRLSLLLIVVVALASPVAAQSKSKPKPSAPRRPFYRAEESTQRKPLYRYMQPPANTAQLNKALTTAIGVEKADIFITRAKYYRAAGLEDSERREFDRALAVDPESEDIIIRVASLITSGGVIERCHTVNVIASNYLYEHPKNDAVLAERAKAKKCLDDLDGAFDDLATALEIDPKKYSHVSDLSNIPRQAADVKAFGLYQRVIDLMLERIPLLQTTILIGYYQRSLANTYVGRASLYRKLGDKDSRLSDLSRAVDLWPETRPNRAIAYEEYKMYDQAIADMTLYMTYLRRPDNLRPTNLWQEYSTRASMYAKAGRYSEAISDYKKALEVLPKNSWIQDRINELQQKVTENPR